ncbi:MAG: sugar phosphate nucleotidyltransferase [Pseudomonadota bacterium]
MTDLTSLQPVVLCGGSGTRLWPASRQSRPKQFLPLVGKASLFQATLERFAARVTGAKPPLVVGSTSHQSTLEEQLSAAGLLEARKILEPVARNSGPAVLAAALVAAESDPATPLLIMPSDHAIGAVDLFRERIAAGLGPAGQGRIVTFGLTPDSPHTGYGYLQAGERLEGEAWGDQALP